MKKFLFALMLVAISAVSATAQSTSPKFGTTAATDNTFRKLSLGYTSYTDATGFDSVRIAPSRYKTYYRIALTDSFRLGFPTVTKCNAGDEIVIIATGTNGNKLTFTTTAGTTWRTAGTATLSTNTSAVITFVFSGTVWIEKSRVVQ